MNKNIGYGKAIELYDSAYKIDLQLGFEPEIDTDDKWHVLDNLAMNGFNLVSLAIATDSTSLDTTIRFIANLYEKIKLHPDKYILVESVNDIKKAKDQNKLGLTFLLQGPNPLDKNFNMLEIYYKLGVRSLILAYNIRNAFADGCIENKDADLSKLGRQLVHRMNKLGMVIDCSHTGYHSSLEAIELSEDPVVFSHSNVYNIHTYVRNLKDEQIKAIARKGGIIGINGNAGLLGTKIATVSKFVEHIDYIAQLVGTEYISLGLDQIYFPQLFDSYMSKQSIFYSSDYKKGINSSELTYLKPRQIIEVVLSLINLGYSDDGIAGILGNNYLKLIDKVWRNDEK